MLFCSILLLAYDIPHKFDEFAVVVLVAATTFSILDTLFPSVIGNTINGSQGIGFNGLNNSYSIKLNKNQYIY